MDSIPSERINSCGGKRATVRLAAAYVISLGVMSGLLFLFLVLYSGTTGAQDSHSFSSGWHYQCVGGYCQKEAITDQVTKPVALDVCQMFCAASSNLWPKPTGHLSLSKSTVQLNSDEITFAVTHSGKETTRLLEENVNLLKKNVKNIGGTLAKAGGLPMVIQFTGLQEVDDIKLTLDTDESYTLSVRHMDNATVATITAKTYFGLRHGLTTLSQLIIFDNLRNEILIADEVYITDGPVYPYRGILLDTSRNFINKATILRTIEAMGMSKLNTLHWHITDSQSFPYVSKTYPQFSKLGAYTPEKVYTAGDIREIVEFGLMHGVRVLPEFDAPAHVGEGWQWVGPDATVCFKAEPWGNYCVEPPCGQLNPTSEKVYEVLEGIYKDMLDDFNQPDIFHMGGDEVSTKCWNSSSDIVNWMRAKSWDLSESSFYRLWNHFQQKALEKLKIANGGKEVPVVLWTSGLTNEENIKYLDPKQYIIQIWTTGTDPTIKRLLRNNFKVIFSNYDALYLDCGFAAWVGEGTNWCAPYKGWQTVYDNSPLKMVKEQSIEDKKHLILGGEAALWTEQADSAVTDARLWPRSAALAERLWTEPNSTWIHAEHRMLAHRERLVKRGIMADRLQPEWCSQNQGHCYA